MKPFARLVEFADEKTQRLDRSAQHIRRAPAPDHISTRKLYGEARERIRPFLRLIGGETSFAEEIRAMEAKSRDGVRCAKRPARKNRVHDFEPVSDPVDAAEQFVLTHVRIGLPGDMQGDFGLDERFR